MSQKYGTTFVETKGFTNMNLQYYIVQLEWMVGKYCSMPKLEGDKEAECDISNCAVSTSILSFYFDFRVPFTQKSRF